MNCSARNNSDSLFDLTGKRELELLEELMIFSQLNIIIKIIFLFLNIMNWKLLCNPFSVIFLFFNLKYSKQKEGGQ